MSGNGRTRNVLLCCSMLLVFAGWMSAPACGDEPLDLKTMFREGIPPSPYIGVVYRYADTMLEHGRDRYGPKKTGLLLSALDRKTLSALKTRPPAPGGLEAESRPGPRGGPLVGANPQMDQNVLRLLYFLAGLSAEGRYGKAADEELAWFFKHAAPEEAGLLPWGEHSCWNVVADEAACAAETPAHRFLGPWMLWEHCFRLAPERSRRFAARLRDAFLSGSRAPLSATESPRQAGFFIRTWAEAYAHTGDKTFLTTIEALLARHEKRRRLAGKPTEAGSVLSMAIDCDGAARKVPEPSRTRLARFAAAGDRFFCLLPHDLKDRRGFVGKVDLQKATPNGPYTSPWRMQQDRQTTAGVAMMCVSRYENTGQVGYREWIVAAADAYLDSLPDGRTDAWPMTFGQAISLELAAFRITAARKYRARAARLAEVAVERFFGESALPRASLKTEHYESTTGAGTLLLALAELHLSTRHITAVRIPANTIDR